MMKSKTISILIPCFNVGPYIRDTLESITRQIDDRVEIICYNDGSQDNTASILNEYPSIKIISSDKNGGVGNARNVLISKASGEYFWFIDGDDILADGAYKNIREVIDTCSPESISFNFTYFGDKYGAKLDNRVQRSFTGPAEDISYSKEENYISTLDSGNYNPWLRVFHKNVHNDRFSFRGEIFEDMEIIPILILNSKSHYHMRDVVINYRIHNDSITAGITPAHMITWIEALSRQREVIERELGPMTTPMRDSHIAACARALRYFMNDTKNIPSTQKMNLYSEFFTSLSKAHGVKMHEFIKGVYRKKGLSFAISTLRRYIRCKYKLI